MAIFRVAPKTGRKLLYHLVFFIASALIIVAISPREGKFKYEYQKGKPWLSTSLIAPWDFPILKTEAQLNRERDSTLKNLSPYFRLDDNVESTQALELDKYLVDLRSAFEADNLKLTETAFNIIRSKFQSILSEIYQKGVLEANDITGIQSLNSEEVTVIRDKIVEKRPVNSVFVQKNAYQYSEEKKKEMMSTFSGSSVKTSKDFISRVAFYSFIKPNIIYDEATTTAVRDQMIKEISTSHGLIQEGELIISRGEIVTDSKYLVLESLRNEYEKRLGKYDRWLIVLGRFIIVTACYLGLFLFMYHYRTDILSSTHKTFFILLLVLLFITIARLVAYMPGNYVFFIPFAIIPIVIRTFYDSRLALYVYLITIMIAGYFVPNSFEFVFISYVVGVIVMFSLTNVYRREKLFTAALVVFLTYSIVYLGVGLMQEGNLSRMDWRNYLWFAGNSVLVLLSYPMIFVFEKAFRFVSDATLFELSDTNQPLLRKLSEDAPGSFQHSLQVANLAGEIAVKIGADHLLTRAGALYHDIGKIKRPEYYVENQSEGFSPHDQLDPLKSSEIIIDHVAEGVELAKKFKLPSPIIDFILTHHGTTVAYYFYKKYLDQNPKGKDMKEAFTYPGPKPFSKETAILMMADAVEAASRSLPSYSEENITDLVERIIYLQEQDGQFSETPLTYKDISDIKSVCIKRLLNIYHARIAYPSRDLAAD